MIESKGTTSTRHTSLWRWIVSTITILVMLAGGQAFSVKVAQAASGNVILSVVDATTGVAITDFKYIINIDNTGTTTQRADATLPGGACSPVAANGIDANPDYPGSCDWVSIAGRANHSDIYTQGTQADFDASGLFTIDGKIVKMPVDRYLISVLADGYRLDGEHFEVKDDGNDVNVTVKMLSTAPVFPTATVQAAVFEDMFPTNSGPDLPAERGLAGFRAHINDYIDEVTTDVFGNPLGAEYDALGEYIPGTGGVVLSKCYVVNNGEDLGWVDAGVMGRCPLDLTGIAQMHDINYPHGLIAVDPAGTIEGKAIIPNVGPNRYALSVTPPDKSGWIQTTTLEGNHDWDAWVMEGATGLDTEFVVAGEPFPATWFGFVRPSLNPDGLGGTATISGTATAINAMIPPKGGIYAGEGVQGGQPKDGGSRPNPVHRLFVSLSDLNANDQTVFIQEFGCDIGTMADCSVSPQFEIPNVPDGDYVLGVWDEPQDYIFDFQNVSVRNGVSQTVNSSLLGWWTPIDGYVFNDLNENGQRDPGEPGISGFTLTQRMRENSLMDRGSPAVTTDANGYYWMESGYPMNQWLVMEAYADGLHTTGITYWADNNVDANGNPIKTTVLGAGVDLNFLPVFSQTGHVDWGVTAYKPGENGGIVGTVSYDVTRNELDPAYAAIEDWQPSISNINVDLYAPVACGTHPKTPCDAAGQYELAADGSYAVGPLLNRYLTETWERPSGCTALDINGVPLVHGVDEKVLPIETVQNPAPPCLEGPMLGVQFGPMATDLGTANENFGAAVDGNYGFGDGCYVVQHTDPDPALDQPVVTGFGLYDPNIEDCAVGELWSLPSNKDYLVRVDVPDDPFGRPLYQVTREEDINVANGDAFVPQVPPSACAGALHTVDLGNAGLPSTTFDASMDNYPAVVGAGYDINGLPVGVTVPASTPVENAPFVDMGGTIYEGQQKPLCDMKIIHLGDRKSIAPGFNFFTDVPLPGRFWGLIVDDLNFSSNPKQLLYGEKMGLPFTSVGIYDYTNRLITTVESDYNGLWDVLLPATNRISCPTPSGVCANMYRTVGNDPGTPGHWNASYNPQYRTISAEFEAFSGLTVPADLAPTQVAIAVQLPGSQTLVPISCSLNDMTGLTPATNPEFFAISKPFMYTNDTGSARTFQIHGLAFGNAAGVVQLDNFTMSIGSWSDTDITFTVPSTSPNNPSAGTHQLKITTADGKGTINALTFHVVPGNVNVYEVSSDTVNNPKPYTSIQGAIDAAAAAGNLNNNGSYRNSLVVVYPGAVDLTNPRYNGRGAYYENPIMYAPVQLQGVGPGGLRPDGSIVQGSIIDGLAFGGDTALAEAWLIQVGGLTWSGNQNINDGQVIYVLASAGSGGNGNGFVRPRPDRAGSFNRNNFPAMIDGFNIRGGDQQGIPPNIVEVANAVNPNANLPVQIETQGGAIFANSYVTNLQVTNNVIESNGGSYGAIRIGTPNLPAPDTDNHNDNLRIAHNRILSNGGTNLAGAIGLFNGADGYEIANNDLCGNFSAEYGGAISHFGVSNNGSIHDNRIYFNRSYDEGAGILIGGELATNPDANYGDPGGPQGSGAVDVFNNLIQANTANDDGGGIRFLMVGNYEMNVYNNMIVNNISTHEGGGVALDDASNVRFYNNTVMNNKTTATAITSDGNPAPAGLSTGPNSVALQATLPAGSPSFSNPLLFNNIFFNNWAGTSTGGVVTGVSEGDANPWDMGSVDPGILLSPTDSVIETSTGINASGTNIFSDPSVFATHDIPLAFTNWGPVVTTIMVTVDLPPTLMGNYHIQDTSPARDEAADTKSGVSAPSFDFDNEARPTYVKDIGADEIPVPGPVLTLLDNFNRANATTLGANWIQANTNLRISNNQAFADSTGQAIWAGTPFGSQQAAALTFANNTRNGVYLILKATYNPNNANLASPNNFIRVRYANNQVFVEVKLAGVPYSTIGVFPSTFVNGDTLTAVANADGSVDVWKTSNSTTTYLGRTPTSSFTGGGRIGIRLPSNARVDDFKGGNLP